MPPLFKPYTKKFGVACVQKSHSFNIVDKMNNNMNKIQSNLYISDVIRIEDELWEVADIELDDFEDVFNKQSDTEYEYITSFYNGGCCLEDVLESGLTRALKRDRK